MEGINPQILKEICEVRMPFGKYKETILGDLPISYLKWFMRNGGFPQGKLGCNWQRSYEIKLNGLMDLLKTAQTIIFFGKFAIIKVI